MLISIHSLRMEGDMRTPANSGSGRIPFQSTPSAWRETIRTQAPSLRRVISIHSLRMEGDLTHPGSVSAPVYLNPLPPLVGRQQAFQSNSGSYDISIHSLRMEGDPSMLVIYNR